jgi:opacity protein-like surface antigen
MFEISTRRIFMKNLVVLSALFLFISFATASFSGQVGAYIAPKLLYSHQIIGNSEINVDVPGLVSSSDELSGAQCSSFGGGLAVGYDFKPNHKVPVRVEVEYAMRSQSEEKYSDSTYFGPDLLEVSGALNFSAQSIFLNIFYDFDTGTNFTPYIGGGLGFAIIDAEGELKISANELAIHDESASSSATNFAFNIAGGCGYEVNDNITLDLGYRYTDFGDAETGDVGFAPLVIKGKADLAAHEVLFGFRYTF